MRLSVATALFLALLVARAHGDDGAPLEVPRTAPRQDLAAALSARAGFESVRVELPFFTPTIRIWSLEDQGEADRLCRRIHRLDVMLSTRATMSSASEDELIQAWTELESGTEDNPGPVLLELTRRSLPKLRARIESSIAGRGAPLDRHQLTILTALRRASGHVDPLRVRVAPITPCTFPEMPEVVVTGVEVRDDGVETRTRFPEASGMNFHPELVRPDGRIEMILENEANSSWKRSSPRSWIREFDTAILPLVEFFRPVMPGRYQLRVHYSPAGSIVEPDSTLNSVTFASEPVALEVKPRRVLTTRSAQAAFASLADSLPINLTIDVVSNYGEWAYSRIRPEDPAGKLLRSGWEAVPALVAFVSSESVPGARRAWAFSVLHGITGLLPPYRFPGTFADGAAIHDGRLDSAWRKGAGIKSSAQARLASLWRGIVVEALEVTVE